ncbi:MAG: hypothetical protein GY951_18380 [Psychromonas sp.]|nr:hypothetical protein [Psychromonas sp.]
MHSITDNSESSPNSALNIAPSTEPLNLMTKGLDRLVHSFKLKNNRGEFPSVYSLPQA